jgi:hypothetical protein
MVAFGGLAALGPSCTPAPAMGAGGMGACLSNPFVCPADETCWPNDMVTTFMCLPANTAKKPADVCDFIGGSVECGPAEVCIVQGTNAGVCTPYCDPSHTCPSMAACESYMITGPTGTLFVVHACDAVTIAKTGATSSSTGTTSSASTGTGG